MAELGSAAQSEEQEENAQTMEAGAGIGMLLGCVGIESGRPRPSWN